VDHASSRHRGRARILYAAHTFADHGDTDVAGSARTAVSIFSSALYLGQSAALLGGSLLIDHAGGPAIFIVAALPVAGARFWFAARLRRRAQLLRRAPTRSISCRTSVSTIVGRLLSSQCCRNIGRSHLLDGDLPASWRSAPARWRERAKGRIDRGAVADDMMRGPMSWARTRLRRRTAAVRRAGRRLERLRFVEHDVLLGVDLADVGAAAPASLRSARGVRFRLPAAEGEGSPVRVRLLAH